MSSEAVAADELRIEAVSVDTKCAAPKTRLAAPASAVPRNDRREQSASDFNMAADSMPELVT